MNLNLNMEIGKKKAVYPSKKSINLYYQEDVSTKISTIALDVIFVVVVVVGLAKLLVFDVIADKTAALEKVEELQKTLDQQLVAIADYDDVADEYARYSYKILVESRDVIDRTEILAMLENTVFQNGSVSNVSITGNVISFSFAELNLNESAELINSIQAYEMVESVEISNQSGSSDGTYEGSMVITLVSEDAGGEQ